MTRTPRFDGSAGIRRDAAYRASRAAIALASSVAFPGSNIAGGLNTASNLAVIDGGNLRSATVADIGALIGGGGGGAAWRWQEVNLGSVPSMSGTFVVSYSGATVGQAAHVIDYPVVMSTGELGDRCEADSLTLTGIVLGADQITVHWRSTGPLAGLRAIAFSPVNLA